jgi:hypothetical protein
MLLKKGGNIDNLNKGIYEIKRTFYNIKEPDKLLLFLNDKLKPSEKAKNERGEVFTPLELVNEMLDKLPNEVWSNPNLKFLDPATGIGNFPVMVYLKLMDGLKYFELNPEKRRKHILENMLYMVEIDKLNVFLLKKVFCGNIYNLNIFEGSFIKETDNKKVDILFSNKPVKKKENLEFEKKISEIKFDIILGNPPFQEEYKDNKKKPKNNNLWTIFLSYSYQLLKYNGYLLLITPTSWMSPSFKNKNIFYKNWLIYVNINECKKWFPSVGSQFSYYLIQKTTQKKETNVICKYNKKIYKSTLLISNNLKFIPSILTKESLSIIKKFYNNDIEKISFVRSYEITTSKKLLIGKCNNKYKYPIKDTKKNTDLCSSIKHSLQDKNKIIMSRSGNLEPIYDNGIYGITENLLYLLTNKKNYINILNSKLFNFIFEICKSSGYHNPEIFKDIPFITENKTDEELYKIFKLTKDEIKLINEII